MRWGAVIALACFAVKIPVGHADEAQKKATILCPHNGAVSVTLAGMDPERLVCAVRVLEQQKAAIEAQLTASLVTLQLAEGRLSAKSDELQSAQAAIRWWRDCAASAACLAWLPAPKPAGTP